MGVSFHVGSQCMRPTAYSAAMAQASRALVRAGVLADVVDVGGGFPSIYPGMTPPALEDYFDAIQRGFAEMMVHETTELWCEPGRALCAEYASLLVKVEKRRGNELFINDGAYGSLFDAAHIGWRFPVALQRSETSIGTQMAEFSFYGPTCDDMDHMAGPFILPDDVKAGDYIEVGILGAYGCAMRTEFNGFGETETVVVEDEPMATLYGWAPANDTGVRATRSQSSKV
jgi:ornithine decarboxylase